jgi:hypothetical protein
MAPHPQVWAIQLKHESGLDNGVVFFLHDVCQVCQIGVAARVILVS